MADAAPTRASLLVRIRDAADGSAWAQFVQLYTPLIYGFARKRGLQDADAADLTQDVLAAVSRAVRRLEYDPAKGTFRGWLFTAVRHRLRHYLVQKPHQPQGTGDSQALQHLAEQPAPEEKSDWEQDYEQRLFHWAADQVRPTVADSTWQAFWQTTLESRDPKEVAGELGMQVAAVYMAKSRVLKRLKETMEQAQGGLDPV
jgi:RNA polymerase sigma factor (sigma-70 family)